MNLNRPLLALTLLSAMSLNTSARTFEIVFDVTANQREISNLTANVDNQLRPNTYLDNTFSGSQFQLTMRVDDQGYSLANSPTYPINIGRQLANTKISSFSSTPFSNEINSVIPNSQNLQNNLSDPDGLDDFGLLSRSMTISGIHRTGVFTQTNYSIFSGEYQSGYFGPDRVIGNESIIANREIFQRELSINYLGNGWQGLQANNYPLIDLSTSEGMLSVLNLIKDNQETLEFNQRALEIHSYGVDPKYYYPCDSIDCIVSDTGGSWGDMNFNQNRVMCVSGRACPVFAQTGPINYLYNNGVRYSGSATIASITEVNEVPVPAAAWLMGSGLLGLIGMAKRRK